MADVTPQDAVPATNASNSTRYFHLPLFVSTDRPSWLVDWNGAMNEIDTLLQDISTASEGAVSDVSVIQTQIDALSTTVNSLNGIVETAVADVAAMQTTVDSQATRMDSIEADLITQNNLVKTLSDAVTAMQGTVATLSNRVAAVETTVSGYDTEIAAISSGLQSVQASLTSVNSQISSLNSRVTALENAGGGGGLPTFSDLTFTPTDVNLTSEISGATGTAYTAAAACYVYFRSWLTLNYTEANRVITKGLDIKINGTTVFRNVVNRESTTQTAVGTQAELYSGMFKLAQGDVISYECTNTWGDGGPSNMAVYSAPVTPQA